MSLPPALFRYRAEVEAELRSAVEKLDSPLKDMLGYHLGWLDARGRPEAGDTGKRLRPALCLLTCASLDGDPRQALPAAAALELVHNFSLVHDDIQDGDLLRRHRPTVWSLWGKRPAFSAGWALWTLALGCLQKLSRSFPMSLVLRADRLLQESCLEMIQGQYLDISYEGKERVSLEDYLNMIGKKTGALIACALKLGGLLSPQGEETLGPLERGGRLLGLAFQIKDDVLGIWGDERRTGKPGGSDLRKRKKTLPVVYALEKGRREVLEVYRKPDITDEDVLRLADLLEDIKARDYAQQLVESYCDRSREELKVLGLSGGDFDQVFDFLKERGH